MKTPQQHTSATRTRDSTPIRTHSPYSEAEGPIVDRGYVEARVRAIEGAYKQLWAPPSSERREIHHLPQWKLQGSQLRAASEISKSYRQDNDPFSDIVNHRPADHVQDYVRGPPQPRKSLQHLSSMARPSRDIYHPDRKSQSLANIRARYETSPLQGKTGRRISNIGRTSSVESGILSPLPHPVSRTSKSIAEGLDEVCFWPPITALIQFFVTDYVFPVHLSTYNRNWKRRLSVRLQLVAGNLDPERIEPFTGTFCGPLLLIP